MNAYFDHEKLDVYRTAISFVLLADEVVKALPEGRVPSLSFKHPDCGALLRTTGDFPEDERSSL